MRTHNHDNVMKHTFVMKYSTNLAFFLIAFVLLLSSCDKEDPVIPNEEELITTLTYTLTPAGGGAPVILSFVDLDGDGGNAPTLSSDAFAANQTYSGVLVLQNESISPVDNITLEIEEEAEEHQFFFQSTVTGLSIAYNDQDGNGNPIGLSSTLTTGAAGTGTLTIVLRHEPDKAASGVAGGDIVNAGGETDIQVTFDIDVQ